MQAHAECMTERVRCPYTCGYIGDDWRPQHVVFSTGSHACCVNNGHLFGCLGSHSFH